MLREATGIDAASPSSMTMCGGTRNAGCTGFYLGELVRPGIGSGGRMGRHGDKGRRRRKPWPAI